MSIDMHVHPWTREFIEKVPPLMDALHFFRTDPSTLPKTNEDLLREMDQAGVKKAVLLGHGNDTIEKPVWKNYRMTNEQLRKLVDLAPDRFVGFLGVDPHRGREAVSELEHAVKDLGLRGMKVHAPVIEVYPNDEKLMYPLYEKCVELDIPVIHHTGTTGLGRCKIKYSHPVFLDDVAQDFPELRLLCAHFGWPWLEETLAIAIRNPNVYLDVSGWSPRYLPATLVQYMNGLLKEKVLFGTDYPMFRMPMWMEHFEKSLKAQMKPENIPRLLSENAERFLAG